MKRTTKVTLVFDLRPWYEGFGACISGIRCWLGQDGLIQRGLTGDVLSAEEGRLVADTYDWSLLW